MKRIELIGAQGTGKTTLLQSIATMRNNKDNWVLPEEARLQIAKSLIRLKNNKKRHSKLFNIILKTNINNKINNRVANKILGWWKDEVYSSTLREYEGLLKIHVDEIINGPIWHDMLSIKKITLLNMYLNMVYVDAAIFDYFNYKKLVVLDDGIIHNNFGITESERYQYVLDNYPKYKNKINPAGVIYCKLNAEKTFLRSKNRISKIGTIESRALSDNELMTFCENRVLYSAKQAEIMNSQKIPVFEVNMESINFQTKKNILHFIRHFDK